MNAPRQQVVNKAIFLSWGVLCLLSITAFLVNNLFFHFKGNNYFPPDAIQASISFMAVYAALRIYLPHSHYLLELSKAILSVYICICSVALITNAAQYTPFKPIDEWIIGFENRLGIDMIKIVAWTSQYHAIKKVLEFIYGHLSIQLTLLPILAAVTGQFYKVYEYIFLILISAIAGFTFYYFFPTVAPATMLKSGYFNASQFATGVKFWEIHRYLQPTTMDGGMVAMPSFHAIWAWFSLYLIRNITLLFWILLPWNILLMMSCVLLGWHYPLDLLASLIVICLSHWCFYRISNLPSAYIPRQ